MKKKNVALVLSSGGARGLAHIGAIEELERAHYAITSIAGCSMGALVGGMYAAGKLGEVKRWMIGLDRKQILSLVDFSFSLNHLVKGVKVIDALKQIVPDVNIEDLPIPYAAVATDWNSGREVVFRSGSLYEAIRSSISIPLFFNPVRKQDMLLVDGALVNALPLNRVERTKGDMLVGVNVCARNYREEQFLRYAVEEETAGQVAARLHRSAHRELPGRNGAKLPQLARPLHRHHGGAKHAPANSPLQPPPGGGSQHGALWRVRLRQGRAHMRHGRRADAQGPGSLPTSPRLPLAKAQKHSGSVTGGAPSGIGIEQKIALLANCWRKQVPVSGIFRNFAPISFNNDCILCYERTND